MRYQEANGALPTELKQLDEVNATVGIYLRQPFTDPMYPGSKLEDWCLLRLNAGGRAVSSCSREGASGLGLGSGFTLGQEAAGPTSRPSAQGLAAGQGIIGVHSKSGESAFNTVKRQEKTYDRWYYTAEDYRKEMGSRSIPGLTQTSGPGMSGQQPGQQNQQGQQRISTGGN